MVKSLKLKQKATLNRLEFVPAKFEKQRPAIRSTGLNIVELDAANRGGMKSQHKTKKQKTGDGGGDLQSPGSPRSPHSPGSSGGNRVKTRSQDELFPREELCMQWSKMRRAGSGLVNLGNTCFMNSVLQCLVHTPALAELLLSRRNLAHKPAAHGELDPIGMTQRLVEDSLEGKKNVISPVQHAKSLKRINRGFRLGRQEDAHEYLIALLDAMHDRSIAGMNPKPSRELEYTSFIYQIFGGKIRSQLKCTQCDYVSNTYDPFLDLSLEISRAHSVQKALERFTEVEVLDGQNSYKCPKQNKMVRAIKRMTIEDAPNTLIIQLKRFEFSRSGRKISKHVDFDETIDLTPFMSHPQPKGMALYDLYGILVHDGFSMHSGHYYSFLRSPGGEWHRFDDSRVAPSSARNAMGQQPYILFYTRRSAVITPGKPKTAHSTPTSAARGKQEKNKGNVSTAPDEKRRNSAIGKTPTVSKKAASLSEPVVATNGEKKKKAAAHENKLKKQASNKKRKMVPTAKSSSKMEENADGKGTKTVLNKTPLSSAKRMLFSPGKRAPSRSIRSPGASLTPIARSKTQRGYNILPKKYSLRDAKDTAKKKRKAKGALQSEQPTIEASRGDAMDIDTKKASLKSSKSSKSSKSPNPATLTTPSKSAAKTTSVSKRGADAIAATAKSRGRASMGLDTWDTIDAETKKQRDVNMVKSGPAKGNKPDAYDAEYDKGRVKKVRKKGEEPGTNNSKLFDAFQKVKTKGKSLVAKALGAGQKKRKR